MRVSKRHIRLAIASLVSFALNLMCGAAFATPPIQTESLTPQNSARLGFDISVYHEGPVLQLRIMGPKVVKEDCLPRRSGMALLDNAGHEIAVYIADYELKDGRPTASGYYSDQTQVMDVFVDYFCRRDPSKSRRYIVKSISEYLKENASERGESTPGSSHVN